MIGCARHMILRGRREGSQNRCIENNRGPTKADMVESFES